MSTVGKTALSADHASAAEPSPPAPDRPAAAPDIAVPAVELPPPLEPITRGDLTAVMLAAALHIALIGAFLTERVSSAGSGGTLLEVVTVDIVESAIGRRLVAGDNSDERNRRAPDDGIAEPAPEAAAGPEAKLNAAVSAEPPPPDLPAPDDPQAAAPRAMISPRIGDGQSQDSDSEAEQAPMKADRSTASEASAPSTDAGGGLRGTHAYDMPEATAAAAGGAANAYARAVLEVLSRSRPAVRPGNFGRVRFAFAVSPTGYATAVRITGSSGNRSLDEATLAAVRDLRFPPPPAGLRGGDLLYETHFDFRPEKRS